MRRVTARSALGELSEMGFLEIRTMARTGEIYIEDEILDPDVLSDVSTMARIYMISDVCHGFVYSSRRPRFAFGERNARKVLEWRWSASGSAGRRWIRSRFRLIGDGYSELLEDIVGAAVDDEG